MFTRTGGIEPDMRGISGLSIDQLAVSEAFEASMTASSFALSCGVCGSVGPHGGTMTYMYS